MSEQYEYFGINQEIIDFLIIHKNNQTPIEEIDNLLQTNFTNFYNTLDFGKCNAIDMIYTGKSGSYWRSAYLNPNTNQTIPKGTLLASGNITDCPIYVKFAGIYTCNLEFDYSDRSFDQPAYKRVRFN